jgi:ELWxxDGT repeat protein
MGATYFVGTNAASGAELWKSDGTTAGTTLLKDINPGSGSSTPAILTSINGLIYFLADNGTSGKELWCTNGTTAGTMMLKDINPGTGHSDPTSLTNINGRLFFIAHNGVTTTLWRSDGTPAGTIRLSNASVSSFTNLNGVVYFVGTEAVYGSELWKTDGTQTGTLLLKDIYPGTGGSAVTSLQRVNTTVYFQANDGTHGAELWKTDGTSLGTKLVKDIQPGPGSSSPTHLTNAGGRLVFRVVLPYKDSPYQYQQFWSSNGTESGTGPVSDAWDAEYLSDPNVYSLSNGVFAVREDYGGYENQYRGYDVLAYSLQADTMTIQIQSGYSYVSEYIDTYVVDGVLHVITSGDGEETHSAAFGHWRSDGLGDQLYSGSYRASIDILAIEKGNLYYTIEDTYLDPYSDPYEIHATGPNPSEWPDSFTALTHNGIKYSSKQDKLGTELWRTAPMARVRDLTPGSAESTISSLVGLNNAIYFTFNNGTNGDRALEIRSLGLHYPQ